MSEKSRTQPGVLQRHNSVSKSEMSQQSYIISSKFIPPKSPASLIQRFTLPAILKEIDLKNLVLITAPAGYGKTTLLAQLRSELSASGKKVAWLTLDENDTRVSQFTNYLIECLTYVDIPIGKSLLTTFQKKSESALEYFGNILISQLHAYAKPLVLIIDDIHYVKNPEIIRLIDQLISYAPPNLCLVIASRHEPQLSTASYRIHGSMIEIKMNELKFSYEEAHIFIHQILELDSDNYSLSRRLYEFTNGWIAALQLALISIKNCHNVDRLLTSYKESKTQLAEFLYTDVLSRLSEEITTFLLKTSILNYMQSDLCAAVSGIENSEKNLEQIKKLNLFLMPVEHKETWYTYHPLFREFLHANLEKRSDINIQELHWKASEWYESNNQIADALKHALNGNENARTLKLVEKVAHSFLSEGQFQTLIELHEILDPQSIEDYPNLWISTAYSLMLCFRITAAKTMMEEIQNTHIYENPLVKFQLSVIELTIAMYEDNRGKIFSLYEKWPAFFPFRDTLFVPASLNPVSIAFSQIGEFQKARDIYSYLTPIPEKDRGLMPTTYQKCYLAHSYFQEGRIEVAEVLCQERLALDEQRLGHFSAAACCCSAFLSEILYEKNQLKELFMTLSERMEIIRENLTPDGILKPYISLTKAAQANNELEKALVYTNELYSIGHKNEQRRFKINALSLRARIYLQMDNLIAAEESIDQLKHMMSSGNLRSPLANEEYVTALLAQVYLHMHSEEYQQALDQLVIIRCKYIYPRQHSLFAKVGALILACKTHLEDSTTLLPELIEVLSAGEKIGLIRTFLDEHAFMAFAHSYAKLLSEREDQRSIYQYYLRLIRKDDKSSNEEFGSVSHLKYDHKNFTHREKLILKFLAYGFSNKVIGNELNLSANTIKYHLKKIYQKTNTSGRVEAIVCAQKLGLIEK